jgi:Tfp pilus assembly protein PilX
MLAGSRNCRGGMLVVAVVAAVVVALLVKCSAVVAEVY